MYNKDIIDLWIRRAEGKAPTNVSQSVCAEIAQAMIAYNSLYGKYEGAYVNGKTSYLLGEKLSKPVEKFRDYKYIVITLAISNFILLLCVIFLSII